MLAVRWIVLLGAMSAAGQVAAQQSCADTLTPGFSERLAYRYAPFIWFSPLERYFPTIPFFPAFDTIAQRSEALPGLNDLTRIAEVTDGKASWDALEAAYVQRRRQPPSPPKYSAVFYRIRCLNARESGTVWTFLRNDPQAWRRSEVKGLYDGGLRSAHFMSVEYYFLYVRDIGLQGHPGDVEKVFVLLPVNPTADDAQFDWEGKSGERLSSEILGRIRIVAGAGHGFTTPNNFLVVVESGAQDTPRHPNLLVEFGGHSVAPENSPPDGRFSPGWDINWNINEAVWGVRDAQAVSGSGFLGSYKEWMTLPRTAGNSVHLFPATQVAEAVVDTTGLDSDTTVTKDQRDAIIRQQTRESPGDRRRQQCGSPKRAMCCFPSRRFSGSSSS